MDIENQQIIEAAERLIEAQNTGIATSPIRNIIGLNNIETAYKVQHLISKLRLDKGSKKIGSKIGLTSFAVQEQLGVDQPDYGSLFTDMQVPNNGNLSFADLMQPKAEAEIAFILSKDLDAEDITEDMLSSAISHALPSIEIVGSRVENWDIKITDTIADNASASHFVLGDKKKHLADIDLINCKMQMFKNGELVSEGKGEACLGSPLKAALWLAQTMKKLGQPLRKGDIILSGALGPMTNLESGDEIRAEIDGLGTVELNIVA